MNVSTGIKTSTAIKLTDKEMGLLEQAQQDGLARGITILSKLTFSKSKMAFAAAESAISVTKSSVDFSKGGSDDTVGSILGDTAEAKIQKLLGKCWDKVRQKTERSPWLTKACHVLEVGLNQLLSFVKGVIFSGAVMAQLVPFYGNVKGIIDGAILAVGAHGHRTATDTLNEMGPSVASGISTEALNGFTKYARAEMIRTAGKSAYTFAKSIGGLLAEIFSFGAWTVVTFVAAVVEAIASFVNSLVQAIMFDRATKKLRDYGICRQLPSAEEFRTILAGCSFVGCVFFAASNYIGHFNVTSVLANPSRVLSTKMLTDSVTKIAQAQKMACGYTTGAAFSLDFRTPESQAEYGWILKMIEGYANDKPKSEFLTSDATRWDRFKHKAKSLRNKLT